MINFFYIPKNMIVILLSWNNNTDARRKIEWALDTSPYTKPLH